MVKLLILWLCYMSYLKQIKGILQPKHRITTDSVRIQLVNHCCISLHYCRLSKCCFLINAWHFWEELSHLLPTSGRLWIWLIFGPKLCVAGLPVTSTCECILGMTRNDPQVQTKKIKYSFTKINLLITPYSCDSFSCLCPSLLLSTEACFVT